MDYITKKQATQIAAQFAEDATYEFNIANAAIQHYLDQHKAEVPVLPEWSKQDNLGGLVPSEIRMSIRDFGQQCAAHTLEEAEKRMLVKAAELGIYNHHATKALVEALKGEVK